VYTIVPESNWQFSHYILIFNILSCRNLFPLHNNGQSLWPFKPTYSSINKNWFALASESVVSMDDCPSVWTEVVSERSTDDDAYNEQLDHGTEVYVSVVVVVLLKSE
jgi:hypothetical protein